MNWYQACFWDDEGLVVWRSRFQAHTLNQATALAKDCADRSGWTTGPWSVLEEKR